MKKLMFIASFLAGASLGAGMPMREARAMSRDVKAVLITGLYGIAAGTALGLISWPMTGSSRAVFIGSSIGMYLGVGTGIYFITHRDDPGNPFAAALRAPNPIVNPALVERKLGFALPLARF